MHQRALTRLDTRYENGKEIYCKRQKEEIIDKVLNELETNSDFATMCDELAKVDSLPSPETMRAREDTTKQKQLESIKKGILRQVKTNGKIPFELDFAPNKIYENLSNEINKWLMPQGYIIWCPTYHTRWQIAYYRQPKVSNNTVAFFGIFVGPMFAAMALSYIMIKVVGC